MLDNPGQRKKNIAKIYIGHTILDIAYKQFVLFSLCNNIAYIDLILKIDADISHLSDIRDCVLSENYELQTYFSEELKNLKPKA